MASLPASVLSNDQLAATTSALEAARRSLDAAMLACVSELDRRGVTEELFGQRTVAWLADVAKLPRAVAAARVGTARKLTGVLGPVRDAMVEGRLGFDHACVIADAANERVADQLGGLVDEICDLADVASFQRWQSEVRGLAEQLDADGGHDPAGDLPEPRLRAVRVGDVTVVDGQLVGDGAHIAQHALDEIADELFRRYTRDAGETGDPVPSRPQLMAAAFVELCRRGLAVDVGGSRPPRTEATVVVNAAEPDRIVDHDGVTLHDTSVLLCDPVLRPVITSFDGRPLARGRDRRLATTTQTRTVNLRDGGCVFPGCDSPAAWNDTHHVDEWGGGGNTDTDRMCGLCRFHHRVAHRKGWSLRITGDGWTRWRRPDGTSFWGQRHQRRRAGPPPPEL